MKISEKQLLMLVDIAKDTCAITDVVGGYDPQTRVQLINDIINQQNDKPMEIDDSKKKFFKVPAPKSHSLEEIDKILGDKDFPCDDPTCPCHNG